MECDLSDREHRAAIDEAFEPFVTTKPLGEGPGLSRPRLKTLCILGYASNAAVGNPHLLPGMQVVIKSFEMLDLTARIKGMVESQS